MRRYRFIIARDNERLYEHLVPTLGGLDEVEVILDRRVTRRGGGSGPPAERRVLSRVDEDLKAFGWAFIKIERG